MATTSGTKANTSGSVLENFVHAELSMLDYMEIPANRFDAAKCLKQPIYAAQYITGTNIYGNNRRVDFIIHHPVKQPNDLVVQCKWQVSGSVDEKYPFEVHNIMLDNIDAVVLLDGGGYSKGARDWLLSMASNDSALKRVLNQGEFSRYLKKNF